MVKTMGPIINYANKKNVCSHNRMYLFVLFSALANLWCGFSALFPLIFVSFENSIDGLFIPYIVPILIDLLVILLRSDVGMVISSFHIYLMKFDTILMNL